MNISDAFESYGLSFVVLLTLRIFIIFRSKALTLSVPSMTKKDLMSCDMHAPELEPAVACTLPTR